MYSWQLPWAIFINYRGWNEMNFHSFTVNISFQIFFKCISFLPMNCSLFHSPWNRFHSIFHSLIATYLFNISSPHGNVFIHISFSLIIISLNISFHHGNQFIYNVCTKDDHMTNFQKWSKVNVVALHCSFPNLLDLCFKVLPLWRI